ANKQVDGAVRHYFFCPGRTCDGASTYLNGALTGAADELAAGGTSRDANIARAVVTGRANEAANRYLLHRLAAGIRAPGKGLKPHELERAERFLPEGEDAQDTLVSLAGRLKPYVDAMS